MKNEMITIKAVSKAIDTTEAAKHIGKNARLSPSFVVSVKDSKENVFRYIVSIGLDFEQDKPIWYIRILSRFNTLVVITSKPFVHDRSFCTVYYDGFEKRLDYTTACKINVVIDEVSRRLERRFPVAHNEQITIDDIINETYSTSEYLVCNTKTKIAHKNDCDAVTRIADNKKRTLSAKEARERGYKPCKCCNPWIVDVFDNEEMFG